MKKVYTKKVFICFLCAALCILAFSGCEKSNRQTTLDTASSVGGVSQQPLSLEGTEESNEDANTPLSLDENDSGSYNSFAEVTINGVTNTYQFKSVFEKNNRYDVLYVHKDNRGAALSTIVITIPACAKAGDVYRYDDEYDRVYGNGSIVYADLVSGKTYAAWYLYVYYPEDTETANFKGADGNKYVIAIDEVSPDGMVIKGRYMVEYIHSYAEPDDHSALTIEESSFVFDRSDAE